MTHQTSEQSIEPRRGAIYPTLGFSSPARAKDAKHPIKISLIHPISSPEHSCPEQGLLSA